MCLEGNLARHSLRSRQVIPDGVPDLVAPYKTSSGEGVQMTDWNGAFDLARKVNIEAAVHIRRQPACMHTSVAPISTASWIARRMISSSGRKYPCSFRTFG